MIECSVCGVCTREMTNGWGSHGYLKGRRFFTCPTCGLPPVEAVFNGYSKNHMGKFDNSYYKGKPPDVLGMKLALERKEIPDELQWEYAEKLYALFNDPTITTYLPLPTGCYLLRFKWYCEMYNQNYEGE